MRGYALMWLLAVMYLCGAEHPVLREDEYETGYGMSLIADGGLLYSEKSQYQSIQIYQSRHFGKILVLDECIQLTERDAHAYNEMLAHVPMMACHDLPLRVLVIGGGDNYVVHEVLKHPSVQWVDHVELDERVVQLCREHFPQWSVDNRAKLHIADGASFVRDAPSESYDVIVQDSSDPFVVEEDGSTLILPSQVLYTKEHFQHLLRILRPNGVLAFQAESYNIPSALVGIRRWRKMALDVGFSNVQYGTISISTYTTGQIGFYLCTKGHTSEQISIQQRFEQLNGTTQYYHPKLQIR